MTATHLSAVRRGRPGHGPVLRPADRQHPHLLLHLRRAAPILSIPDGPADITITNPGPGEVTADDVRFGRRWPRR